VQGEAILRSARIVQVAEEAEVFARIGGVEGAVAEVGKRSGSAYDPLVAECFRAHADALFAGLEVPSAWQAALAAEPGPPVWLPEEQVDGYLGAIAHFVDLKSPFAAGHSTGVAALAADAAAQMGLPEAEVATVRRAGLLHDVGRASVPNRIWEKPGPLTDAEWEHVRLHPYYAERLLGRSDALASVAALAGLHHERLDGSGYYRGLPATLLSPAARVLAAADTYHAMLEPRPYRAPLAPEGAVDALRREVSAGRLDGAAVAAVLRAAGHRVRRRREWPAGLSSREVEVLRLLARGLSNRAVAHQLVLSEATVAAHIRHVYDKIGVTTRAAATLFAMQHGLLDPTLSTEK
jgi:putative nucleotidyltransferase with HDIG domain